MSKTCLPNAESMYRTKPLRIDGKLRYLYRAVHQDGQVLDILVQTRRNTRAAVRFFRRLLKQQGQAPRQRERRMRRFNSIGHAQRFLSVYGTLQKSVCRSPSSYASETRSYVSKQGLNSIRAGDGRLRGTQYAIPSYRIVNVVIPPTVISLVLFLSVLARRIQI